MAGRRICQERAAPANGHRANVDFLRLNGRRGADPVGRLEGLDPRAGN